MQVSFVAVNGKIVQITSPDILLEYLNGPVYKAVYGLKKDGWRPQGKLFSDGAANELTARRPKTFVFVKE